MTDVGSVKGPVVAAVEAARPDLARRFVGGHPMAGSEQEGLDGASVDLFAGATWVLTPTSITDPEAFAAVRAMVGELGADTIALAPDIHDALVAVVSHVPQLAASTLMNVANEGSDRHAVMLRLAAGGFRDMTRIASGNPGNLARHLHREPRRDRHRARSVPRGAHAGAGERRRRRP